LTKQNISAVLPESSVKVADFESSVSSKEDVLQALGLYSISNVDSESSRRVEQIGISEDQGQHKIILIDA